MNEHEIWRRLASGWKVFRRGLSLLRRERLGVQGVDAGVNLLIDAAIRDRVREEVLTKGVDRERGTFTQHYDTREVDASLLVLPGTGFVAGDDPLMLGTIAAVEADLSRDGLLLRYRNETGVDGIAGDEGAFVACSFWLVSAYAAAGLLDRAEALMDRLVGLVNDVGLLSEEYHPDTGHFAGNHPQAFSHLSLVGAALDLDEAARADR